MKSFLSILLFAFLFAACKKDATSSLVLNEVADTTAKIKFSGSFMNGPWGNVIGNAKILQKNNAYQLLLESLSASNGPDLKVYLSKEIMPINFISLGALKSINGSQLYDVPSGTDFTQFKYALIHCQLYNHLFGSAELKQ